MKILKFALAPFLAFILSTVIAIFGFVPTNSMAPMLKPGSLFIGNRLFDSDHIARNDIIIFPHDEMYYLKRVIGLPGDEITFSHGDVLINGQRLDSTYQTIGKTQCHQDYQVPEGSVFVLGDNRQNSYDSRYWDNPFVPVDSITATVVWHLTWPSFVYEWLSRYSSVQIIRSLQFLALAITFLIVIVLSVEYHFSRDKDALLTLPLILSIFFMCAVIVFKLQSFQSFW